MAYIDADFNVYDGAHVPQNCTDVNKAQFSYNAGMLLQGAAFMYNYSSSSANETMRAETPYWEAEVAGLLNGTLRVFFPDGIAKEPACEDVGTCTSDMLSFKGYVARWMAVTAQVAPFTSDSIMATLRTSAQAAIKTCSGGDNGRMCGFKWHLGSWDGSSGAGQQMNVVAALSSLLANSADEASGAGGNGGVPVTNGTGGTSGGDAAAGYGDERSWERTETPITAGDKAGGAILTAVTLMGLVAGCAFVSFEKWD